MTERTGVCRQRFEQQSSGLARVPFPAELLVAIEKWAAPLNEEAPRPKAPRLLRLEVRHALH